MSGKVAWRRYTSWVYTGAMDTKETFVDGIYQERSQYCAAANGATKYYMAFGRVIASRSGSTLSYYMADHLGTTTNTVNASTGVVQTYKYWPFGAQRGTYPTEVGYTGQRNEGLVVNNGLYYYDRSKIVPVAKSLTESLTSVSYGRAT